MPITGKMTRRHRARISKAMQGKNSLYPWGKWFRRGRTQFVVFRGTDFHCSTASMIQQIRNEASARRIGVTLVVYRVRPVSIQVKITDRWE